VHLLALDLLQSLLRFAFLLLRFMQKQLEARFVGFSYFNYHSGSGSIVGLPM
jgi:hypothetical protein